VNELVEKYTTETKNWCIYADVDEFLIYPDCEVKSLKSLTQEMEQEGAEAMQGFMLDVFDPNSFVISINEDNPLKKDLIFYNDYYFDGWENPPYCHVIGGLRTYLYEKLNIILTKTPIIKGGGNIKFVASSHIISPAKIFSKRSCFIHLKYSSNFIDRAKEEAERKVHFKGAKRFKLYFENKNIFDTVLEDYKTNPKFVKFENSAQLSSLGLI